MGVSTGEAAAGAATATNTEGKIRIFVQNHCTYPSPPRKILDIYYEPTDTVATLRKDLVEKSGYPKEAFDIFQQKTMIGEDQDERVLGQLFSKNVNMLTINKREGYKGEYGKDSSKVMSENLKLTFATQEKKLDSVSGALVALGPAMEGGGAAGMSSYSTRSYYDYDKKSSTGFVGLSNQGATCYMNSLIQTLFMTPEFRNALYLWDFNDTFRKRESEKKDQDKTDDPTELENRKKQYEKDSIPRQLQLLFARLQLRDQRAVKTKDLTNSFGWKDSDAFTQHDVQELCRVLFDALEKVLKGTKHENLINDLYQGEMKDYVRCKECGYESSRTDKYLDVPLVIKGFGETHAIKSIEEALHKFVQPELLEKDNQYKCDKCNKKVDAIKGLKFVTFPYLLTMQLKRFDFDYETFRRIKLNDKVTFPMLLDMNQFLEGAQKPAGPSDMEVDEKKDTNKENETTNVSAGKLEVESNESSKSGLEYELYSVLIHRGSALGGHYYAYIKSFEKNKWFEFNDSTVSEIDEDDIKKSFGEEEKPRAHQYLYSSANAYMLMYRRVDAAKNKKAVTNEEIPEELKNKILEETDKRKKKKEDAEKEKDMIKLRVWYAMAEKEVKLHKDTLMSDAVKKCIDEFDLLARFAPDCIRLRNYQSWNEVSQEPYDTPEILGKTLEQLRFWNTKSLIIETKLPEEQFPAYNSSDMPVRVLIYDENNRKFSEAKQVLVDKDATLLDLKKNIAKTFRIPVEKQRLVRETFYVSGGPVAKVLVGDSDSLRMEHRVFEATKVYVDVPTDVDAEPPAFAEIESTRNLIELKYTLPGSEAEKVMKVNKKMTFGELKKQLQAEVNLPLEDFKVSRGAQMKSELTNEKETLEDCKLYDGSRLTVEKGSPMKEGESRLKFVIFDPYNKRTKEFVEDLFELPVQETIKISALRELLAVKLKEEKNFEIEPSRIRIREMYSRSPAKVLKDKDTFKEASFIYQGKVYGLQELDHPEDVTKEGEIAIFVQQWHPSKFELGQLTEITVSDKISLDEFRKVLGEKFSIESIEKVGIAKTMGASFPGPELLEVPELYWDRDRSPTSVSDGTSQIGMGPLYLRDGDIVLFRNNDEPLKELTKEEKRKMEIDSQKKKGGYYHRKEEALVINAKV